MENQEIKVGMNCRVIVEVWRDDELPTVENFYEGKVTEIVERAKHCFYLKIEGLNRLIPIDRATA